MATELDSAAEQATLKLVIQKFWCTSAASMCAESTTFPIDMVKTRLQLQGEAGFTGTNFGFFGMLANIIKNEGISGVYAGLAPAVVRHIPYTGFRAIGYEHIRKIFSGEDASSASMLAKAATGMTVGGLAQAIAVPCDLIKVRMIGDGRLVAAGKLSTPRYSGLLHACKTIYVTEGVRGMYIGCVPAIQRAALVNLGELTMYDTSKTYFVSLFGDSFACHACSAACSGFCASLCSTPADVAKSRIMNQLRNEGGAPTYRGLVHCWIKVVREEGFLALYKGLLPGWMRLGPWQLVFWCTYEQLRIASGVGGFK